MKSIGKKALCALLAAVLLWSVPISVLAVEDEDFPAYTEILEKITEEVPEQDIPEPDESGEEVQAEQIVEPPPEQDEPAAVPQAAPLLSIGGGGFTLAPAEDVSRYPIVRFGGAMNTLYENWNSPGETIVFQNNFFTFDNLWPVVKDAFLAFCRLDYDGVADILSDFLWEWYGPVRMNNEGDSENKNLTINRWDEMWYIGENNTAYFCTDWREDPYISAYKLKAYIDSSGYAKVNLMGVSGNGNTVLAYLKLFGPYKLASLFFNISFHGGSSLYGGLATQKIAINGHSLGNISINKMNEKFIDPDPLEWLVRVLFETGILGLVGKIFKFNYDRVVQKVYEDAAIPLLFTMPHIWSYVPPELYEDAKWLLFKGDPKYDKLVERIDWYHYEVMANQYELLQDAAKVIKVAVRAGYDMPLYGIVEGANVHSDEKVDTTYASFGATCAPLNKPFLRSYQQQVPSEHNYISPDRMIDASTCAIPEVTWFGKHQPHRGSGEYEGWYDWFLREKVDYTVHGAPEAFGQWQAHQGDDHFIPLVVGEPRPAILDYLNLAVLWIMKAWRFMLLLPLFWV